MILIRYWERSGHIGQSQEEPRELNIQYIIYLLLTRVQYVSCISPPSKVDTMALDDAGPGPTLLKGLTSISYLVKGVRPVMMACLEFTSLH